MTMRLKSMAAAILLCFGAPVAALICFGLPLAARAALPPAAQSSSQGEALAEQPPAESRAADAEETPPADKSKWLKAGDYDFAYDAYSSGHYKAAFQSALSRAQAGDPAAQTLLGILYMEGRNVAPDPKKAMGWYRRAAQSGDGQAALRYGIDIFNGLHEPKDRQQGEAYIRRAVAAGVPQAYFYLGQIMMDKAAEENRADIGLEWFLRGAALGDSGSAYAAAQILAEGTEKFPQSDAQDAQARLLLETAANNNSAAAQIDLSGWLAEGRGGAKDERQALDLMKIVAVEGIPPAQVTLARYYMLGVGGKPDKIKAAAWYMAAKRANYSSDDLDEMMAKLSPQQLRDARAKAARLLEEP